MFSSWNELKTYNPNKPDPYGRKEQSLVEEDFHLHILAFDQSQQLAGWHVPSGLIDFMIPDQYNYQGISLTADNYFNTWDSLLRLHSQGIVYIETKRRNLDGKAMGHEMVNKLTQKPKTKFLSKIRIF